MDKTKILLARWLDRYLELGSLDPDDLESNQIVYGLDEYALAEIHTALIKVQQDERVRKGHRLAHELACAIEKELWDKRQNDKARLKVIYGSA